MYKYLCVTSNQLSLGGTNVLNNCTNFFFLFFAVLSLRIYKSLVTSFTMGRN